MSANKGEADLERLRILVSDGRGHRLEEVTHTVTSLGHEVVGHSSLGDAPRPRLPSAPKPRS